MNLRDTRAPQTLGLRALVLLAALGVTGCGGTDGTISGQVTYQGRPLPNGAIEFRFVSPSGDQVDFRTTGIVDGAYRLEHAPLGKALIAVKTGKSEIKSNPMPHRMPTFKIKGTRSPAASPPRPTESHPINPDFVAIPAKYAKPETSGLEINVSAGSNTKNIELEGS